MSAPERLRTADGAVWELRAKTGSGLALYAIEGAPKCCPPVLMATLEELAEHGVRAADLAAVVAELGALPMPVGPVAAPTQALQLEDPHDSPLHRDWRIPHDLPGMGGA